MIKCGCGMECPDEVMSEIRPDPQQSAIKVCPLCFEQYTDKCKEETVDMIQVTHEMAMDGGCPEMEGQWIEW